MSENHGDRSSKPSTFSRLISNATDLQQQIASRMGDLIRKKSRYRDEEVDELSDFLETQSNQSNENDSLMNSHDHHRRSGSPMGYGSMDPGSMETLSKDFTHADLHLHHESLQKRSSAPYANLMEPLMIHIDGHGQHSPDDAESLLHSHHHHHHHHVRPRKKVSLPIINISQDFNFLTVEDDNYRNFLRRSTSPGPASPAPTFASSFEFQHQPSKKFSWKRSIKIAILVIIFLGAAVLITMNNEKQLSYIQVVTKESSPYQLPIQLPDPVFQSYPILSVNVKGAFLPETYQNVTPYQLIIAVEKQDSYKNVIRTISKKWRLGIVTGDDAQVPEISRTSLINLASLPWEDDGNYALVFRTNSEEVVPVSISVHLIAEGIENGAIYGGAVLIGLYILIIFELINRTLSAMLAAGTAIGILSLLNERPTTMEMVSWLDMETLILLFSMMVMVAVFCETGFFDYSAYIMYKVTNGQVWPLITILCLFTAFVSAFLDNVTTVLLMTPVTIRICEAMTLNPVPVLISIVIFSNIGGAVTPVGDPPNVIIANNPEVLKAGIDFADFSLHMILGILPILLISYIQLRFIFRNMKSLQFSEPYEVAELRREIETWLRTADSLSSYSKDENHVRTLLLSKIRTLKNTLKRRIRMAGQSVENYKANLHELEMSCKIRDWPLLIKSAVILTTVIIMFFLHSVPELNLSLGWTALLGAIFLLILADRKELEGIFTRVEWSTLIFFSALFIVMEAVSRLGLLSWIGKQTERIILEVNPESRLTVAIVIILWISGIASAFIDNIPFTTMMIQIVTSVAERLNLPLQPLVWALAFGTCLGGNGTLIGASANVVCAGVADQHGYRFTFMEYFRIGFPMMIVSLIVATAYLLICHTWIGWNS